MARQIPRAYIDNYTRSLEKLSAAGQQALGRRLASVDYSNMTEAATEIVGIMEQYCGVSADAAARIAAAFYEGMSVYQTGQEYDAETISGHIPEATERATRGIFEKAVQGDVKGMTDQLLGRLDYEVKKAAGETVMGNTERDKRDVRYARVPGGGETCDFCIMLASRGFVYKSAASAGELNHYHAHCRCRIVPGFEGATVEGYDPDFYAGLYGDPEAAEEWRAKKAEQAEYYPKELAGTVRQREMSFSEANEHRANPNYVYGGAYLENCQSCVVAFEARLRGYDVQAAPRGEEGTATDRLAYSTRLAWTDPSTGKRPLYKRSTASNPKTFMKWLDSTVESGERYTLEWAWKDYPGYGHIITVMRDERGNLIAYDPQIGAQYTYERLSQEAEAFDHRKELRPKLLNVSQYDFNLEICDEVLEEHGE